MVVEINYPAPFFTFFPGKLKNFRPANKGLCVTEKTVFYHRKKDFCSPEKKKTLCPHRKGIGSIYNYTLCVRVKQSVRAYMMRV